jgi:protein tyrosine/serine phosphatase
MANKNWMVSSLLALSTMALTQPALAELSIEDSFPSLVSDSKIEANSGTSLSATALSNLKEVIPNYGFVSSKLIRGGQPSAAGLKALKAAGVKTIVNLRDGKDDISEERALAKSLGLKFVSIPLSVFKGVDQAQTDKFLATVNNSESQPVFVHCRQGQDRCGTMVAMYRMHEESWTASQAYKEMLTYGFHPMFFGLKGSVFGVSAQLGRPETAPPPSEIVDDLKLRAKKVLSMI